PGRTYQNGHPGVLTMELAILGQGPGGAERFADPVTGARLVTKVPGFFEALVQARRAFALAGAGLVGLIRLLAWPPLGPGPAPARALGRRRGWRVLAADLALWGAAGLVTFVALWPSLWVNPLSTLSRMIEFTRETGGQPDEVGSFFLGQAWGDPGPLFYPVAL